MAINYARSRATTVRLLKENGVVFTGYRPGGVRRVNGVETVEPDTPLYVTGVQTAYKPHEIDGKNILSGDKQIVATHQTAVQTGDILLIDGQKWRVENPWPVKPGAVLICYRLQLRGV